MHKLPNDFKSACDEDGKNVRNKNGDYLDFKGNLYHLDVQKNRWKVVYPNGTTLYVLVPQPKEPDNKPIIPEQPPTIEKPISGMDAADQDIEKKSGCPGMDTSTPEPQILDHPMPDIEISTDTGHERIEPLPPLPRCAGEEQDKNPTTTAHEPIPPIEPQIFKADPKEGDLSGVDVVFRDDNRNHIFDDRKGHVIDTPENRERIVGLVKDPTKYAGPSEWGNEWYGEILPDGTQLWAEVRGNKIINCGINEIPKKYNPKTEYSSPDRPSQK